MNYIRKPLFVSCLILAIMWPFFQPSYQGLTQGTTPLPTWQYLSTTINDLDQPSPNTEQVATLILDIDRDQRNDFVIASRNEPGPCLVWYQQNANGWTKYVIDDTVLLIEAGGAYHDIDGDGDLDIVMGGDARSNEVWWWENPYPTYKKGVNWTRRLIKNSGASKHHDQMFADVDNDGVKELVFWNQKGNSLIVAEIPAAPHTTEPWSQEVIYKWTEGEQQEGLSQSDIDGDGTIDIVGGGRWFKRRPDGTYIENIIDDSKRFSRSATGQLKVGGRPEVVFVCGDCKGPLHWYEWDGFNWVAHQLLNVDVDHGHSLDIADINGDGFLDIFNAEMRLNGDNPDAANRIFYGDGQGDFTLSLVSTEVGNHQSALGDLDNDGDLDILGKPFNWDTPRLDIWLNQSSRRCTSALDSWQRYVVDEDRPWGSIFITAADIDGDGNQDLVTGGWWYQNPGVPDGFWVRHTIGPPLNNMATVYDFDNDGDMDVIGTGGKRAQKNSTFVWARNDGTGNFTIMYNILPIAGSFLQGVAVGRYQPSNELQIAFSWHDEGEGVQMLTIASDPSQQDWHWRQISSLSQNEALTSRDLNQDGTLDLLLGTQWLRNESTTGNESWQAYQIHPDYLVDRNQVADINHDNRLDAIVGFEAISKAGKLAWYEQPLDETAPWIEHQIATPIGPMSLDVQDMDQDGDWDVIVGEHNLANPESAALWIYENIDGFGTTWGEHLVYRGDEHHDGAQTVDIDNDGDLDIISIGWSHNRVLLYENLAVDCSLAEVTPTIPPLATNSPVATATLTLSSTATPLPPLTSTVIASGTPMTTAVATPSLTPTAVVISTRGERIYLPLVIK